MKILLDTHVWLWNLEGSSQLPKAWIKLLANPKNELYLSSISIWETLILGEKKRLILKPDPISWVREALQKDRVQELALEKEVVIKSRQINLSHQDPADRFIAATALVYDLSLATVDQKLRKVSGLVVLPK